MIDIFMQCTYIINDDQLIENMRPIFFSDIKIPIIYYSHGMVVVFFFGFLGYGIYTAEIIVQWNVISHQILRRSSRHAHMYVGLLIISRRLLLTRDLLTRFLTHDSTTVNIVTQTLN